MVKRFTVGKGILTGVLSLIAVLSILASAGHIQWSVVSNTDVCGIDDGTGRCELVLEACGNGSSVRVSNLSGLKPLFQGEVVNVQTKRSWGSGQRVLGDSVTIPECGSGLIRFNITGYKKNLNDVVNWSVNPTGVWGAYTHDSFFPANRLLKSECNGPSECEMRFVMKNPFPKMKCFGKKNFRTWYDNYKGSGFKSIKILHDVVVPHSYNKTAANCVDYNYTALNGSVMTVQNCTVYVSGVRHWNTTEQKVFDSLCIPSGGKEVLTLKGRRTKAVLGFQSDDVFLGVTINKTEFYTVDFAWWNASFGNRTNITVTNNANSKTGWYVIPLTLNFTQFSGIQFDLDDLRFLNATGQELAYHIIDRRTCTSSTEDCRVDVNASVSADGGSTFIISVYYGCPTCTATSYESGTKTYWVFDDFNDNEGVGCPTGWTAGTGTFTEQNSRLEFTTDGGSHNSCKNDKTLTSGENYTQSYEFKFENGATRMGTIMYDNSVLDWTYPSNGMAPFYEGASDKFQLDRWATGPKISPAVSTSEWFRIESRFNQTSSVLYGNMSVWNETTNGRELFGSVTTTEGSKAIDVYHGIGGHDGANNPGGTAYDDYAVYISLWPQPTYTLGSEESSVPPNVVPDINNITVELNGSVNVSIPDLTNYWNSSITNVWINCSDSDAGEPTRINFNITDRENLLRLHDNATNSSATPFVGNISGLSIGLNRSHTWTFTGLCTDGSGGSDENITTIGMPNGTVTNINIVVPTTNLSVVQNETMTFTFNGTCTGGECYTMQGWLDP